MDGWDLGWEDVGEVRGWGRRGEGCELFLYVCVE